MRKFLGSGRSKTLGSGLVLVLLDSGTAFTCNNYSQI